MDVIILCGGLATRLSSVTQDKYPKCLVEIEGRKFIEYQFDLIAEMDRYTCIDRVILALGKYADQVVEYVQQSRLNRPFEVFYSFEQERLGTGGAMNNALRFVNSSSFIAMNGDVINQIDVKNFINHGSHSPANTVTLSLAKVTNTDRYGSVELDQSGAITQWKSKGWIDEGWINRGLYYFNRTDNPFKGAPKSFSFEDEYIAPNVSSQTGVVRGLECDGYFIDIGIPSDYELFCVRERERLKKA
jgi:D-glycero-alpha-D-manno-heptose 1-phosphate guanylyltransferase